MSHIDHEYLLIWVPFGARCCRYSYILLLEKLNFEGSDDNPPLYRLGNKYSIFVILIFLVTVHIVLCLMVSKLNLTTTLC